MGGVWFGAVPRTSDTNRTYRSLRPKRLVGPISAGTPECALSATQSRRRSMFPNREGQRVPNVTFRIRENNEWKSVTTGELFDGKTVVVFSLPGAFTPTCSSTHL